MSRPPDRSAPLSDPPSPAERGSGLSRRELLRGFGLGAFVSPLLGQLDLMALAEIARSPDVAEALGPGPVAITLRVNGASRKLVCEPRQTLLDVLRETLDLTGAKPVCERGACGGCTVLLDGRPVNSCLVPALDARGGAVTTIEGLARGDRLDPVQQAFVEKDALMCGFCTPGMILSVRALLDGNPDPGPEEIRRAVCGNLCRCGTYPHVFAAARDAARRMRQKRQPPAPAPAAGAPAAGRTPREE